MLRYHVDRTRTTVEASVAGLTASRAEFTEGFGCRNQWLEYSRRSTLGSLYGSGFWTNDGLSAPAARRIASGFPKHGFFASGNRGQRIYIVPSEQLIISRFGYSPEPYFGIVEDLHLIDVAIAALR